ncbi:flavin reductase family protein [Microlunatus ginsengisoli]|uniref:Flavin reductase like domain-containing protein n=1 Tax=Microlunatus ginsengisoli TaxID=363863 RepID=A0ABP6ZAM7_9ACTN
MSIHSEHPFLPPESGRDPLRRFRGRMPQPVTVWSAQEGTSRAGWTVSSLLVADGDPAELLGLVDEESDLAELAGRTGRVAISLLRWEHRQLAEAFAGLAPAPGGPFRSAQWHETRWGPVLAGAAGWLGVELTDTGSRLGWSVAVRGRCVEVHVDPEATDVLTHLRGRYRELPLD